MIDLILKPFGMLMKFGYEFLGNYGLALFFYAFVTKLVLFPLSMKQQKSSLAMVRMRPKQDMLMKKYGHNKQRYQEELMRLYEREGYSPMSSCLPTFIQLPIIILIYKIVYRPITYIEGWDSKKLLSAAKAVKGSLSENVIDKAGKGFKNIGNIEIDLVRPLRDAGKLNLDTKFLGIDLTDVPSNFKEVGWMILLIPVLAAATSWLVGFVSQKMNKLTQPTDQQGGCSMKYMNIAMPLLSLWMSFTFTAALGVYWIASNIFALVQTVILHKMYDPQKVLEEEEQKLAQEKEEEREKRRLAAERRAQGNNKNSKKKRAVNAQYTAADKDSELGVVDTEKEN